MSSAGSITDAFHRLKGGDQTAAQELWERYFRQLVKLARKKLRDTPRQTRDEEDVALSAFASFCRGVESGRFPRLDGRDELSALLAVITIRKAIDQVEYVNRLKRCPPKPGEEVDLEQVLSREPSPEVAVQAAEEYQRLLDSLDDDQLQTVAVWKMEGYTNDEIATKLRHSLRSVERKLQIIRNIWERELTP
jgi:RNA polymerase sigma factor (sigma-70 family)